jgi:hypothetical protein
MQYYEILADDRQFPDRWFLGDPRPSIADERNLRGLVDEQAEVWHPIRNGVKIEVRFLRFPTLRYPISVDEEGNCEIDAREFSEGRPYSGPQPSVVPIREPGRSVAFLLAAFDMPVVSAEVAEILQRIAPNDIQRFPITVEPDITGFEIVNIVQKRDCIDESRSKFIKWGPDDGRPDKIGHYRQITKFSIDPSRAGESHLFRIQGFSVVLIASEVVKNELAKVKDLGIVYQKV